MNQLQPSVNVLTFIINLIKLYNKGEKQYNISIFHLAKYNKKIKGFNKQTKHHGNNSANQMGDPFEEFMKDIFADSLFNTLQDKKHTNRDIKIHNTFSYPGNDKNLPDAMIKNGDCLEFKKVSSHPSTIQLNSSYPHSEMIPHTTKKLIHASGTSEEWNNIMNNNNIPYSDLVYVIGYAPTSTSLRSVFMVYGRDFAKGNNMYATLKSYFQKSTNKSINLITKRYKNIRRHDTNELGQIKNIDTLSKTYLRIRGMWVIKDPTRIFNNVFQKPCYYQTGKKKGQKKEIMNSSNFFKKHKFSLALIVDNKKWSSFSKQSKKQIIKLSKKVNELSIKPIQIKNPNNTKQPIKAKLIEFYI